MSLYPLFSFAMLVSAALIFWVQPLFGKMVLPLLGGTASVWNTCLVFFQAALLVGYLYAHAQNRFLRLRGQVVSHLVLLAAVFLFLPIALPDGWVPPTSESPIPWLLLLLAVAVGLPFVALAASAPLFQSWFTYTKHPGASDPYFLYAASNVGSIAGLVGYPLLFERYLTLTEQSQIWALGYVVLFCLVLVAGVSIWKRASTAKETKQETESPKPPNMLRLKWVLLAAVPSSLLQSVTTYITTDIAAVPLLWVIPLVIYLLTFVLVFSRARIIPHRAMIFICPVMLTTTTVLVYWWGAGTWGILLILALLTLFVTAMTCHGEMVRLRPKAEHLTEFYLWMAFGGVLGGVFNAIVAPLVFDRFIEFPLGLIAAGFLLPVDTEEESTLRRRLSDILLPVGIGAALAGGAWVFAKFSSDDVSAIFTAVPAIIAGIVVFFFRRRPLRFGLGLAAVILAWHAVGFGLRNPHIEILQVERSFFGIHFVMLDKKENNVLLKHGRIFHGMQSLDPKKRTLPTLYFHPRGPLGDVFRTLWADPGAKTVAVAGLGAGTMAAYARPQDRWVFYEIDPVVTAIALNAGFFTFLRDARGLTEVILGDARLSLLKAPDHYYDLIAIDVFSSDSIPVHIVTKEAIQLYLQKLKPNGLLVFHISNKYIRLNRVLFKVADEMGLHGVRQIPWDSNRHTLWPGSPVPADWVVLARNKSALGELTVSRRWKPLRSAVPVSGAWSDDYSNLWEFLHIPGPEDFGIR